MQTLRKLKVAVHPRVCGEHASPSWVEITTTGSSPRVRGTHPAHPEQNELHRFIPACAGNTGMPTAVSLELTVHPRVCGEHKKRSLPGIGRNGSSPRVRGTPQIKTVIDVKFRFIPACAGNTILSAGHYKRIAVHPRVCGEHMITRGWVSGIHGSSPRVRGTQIKHRCSVCCVRFIPACAGNTHPNITPRGFPAVHPRVCGEHKLSTDVPFVVYGSSPRVRGTHTRRNDSRKNPRFIPPCAGNTNS